MSGNTQKFSQRESIQANLDCVFGEDMYVVRTPAGLDIQRGFWIEAETITKTLLKWVTENTGYTFKNVTIADHGFVCADQSYATHVRAFFEPPVKEPTP